MEIVVATGLFAASLFGVFIASRGSLLATSLGVAAAVICLGPPFYSVHFGPAPLTLDRLAWVALMLQYALWRRRDWHDPKPWGATDALLVGFLAWLAFSTFAFGPGLEQPAPTAVNLFLYVLPAGLFWVGRQLRTSERGLWWAAAAASGLGVYLGVTAYLETHDGFAWVWPGYLADHDGEFAEFFGRARGPLLNPIGNGLLLTVAMLASLVLLHRRDRRVQVFALTAAAAAAFGCWYTYTRSVWLGAATAAWLFVYLGCDARLRRYLAAATATAALAAAPLVVEKMYAFQRDKGVSAEATADSAELRPILAVLAWQSFLDHPVAGVGLARNRLAVDEYAYDASWGLPLEKGKPYVQHNVFLSLLVETGLVGCSLFVALLVGWARAGLRLSREGAEPIERLLGRAFVCGLAAFLVNGMFHETSLIAGVNSVFFLAAGLMYGLSRRDEANAEGTPPESIARGAETPTGTPFA